VSSIHEFVREQRDSYRSQSVEITLGYEYNQYETLRTIELYHNSRFTTGPKDSLLREKPFYNITKFRVNVVPAAEPEPMQPAVRGPLKTYCTASVQQS
jgi:hypothetical protein